MIVTFFLWKYCALIIVELKNGVNFWKNNDFHIVIMVQRLLLYNKCIIIFKKFKQIKLGIFEILIIQC